MRDQDFFQKQTIARLRHLQADERAIRRLREELKATSSLLHAQQFDKPHVQSSGSGSAVENLVIQRDLLQARLQLLETNTTAVRSALQEVTENERACLFHFYINGERGACARVECELGYSPAQIYRIRDHAVENLAALLFGVA